MAFKLVDIIFNSFFTPTEKREDPNKDGNDKGTHERYQEMLADDWDDNLLPLIEQFIEKTLVPDTVEEKFIPYLEAMVGLTPITDDLVQRRRLLKNILNVYKTKGTIRSYQIVFRSMGFTDAVVTEVDLNKSFDSDIDFDDPIRRFDQGGKCYKCKFYTLNLIGGPTMSTEILRNISKALELVEPIYANVYLLQQDGNEINIITIFVDYNGDLIVENINDDILITLNPNGDLIAEGTTENRYSLASNGDLIYTA